MKLIFLIATFSLIGIEARSLVELPHSIPMVELQNVTASFKQEVSALINVYALDKMVFDGPNPFKMPIDDTKLRNSPYVYMKQSTSPANKNTKTPAFKHSFAFLSEDYSNEAYLAIQFWNQSQHKAVYLGGVKFTIGHLNSLDRLVEMQLSDEQGVVIGSVQFNWINIFINL